MTIRRLTSYELDDMYALSEFAFQYELTPAELEEKKRRERPEQTWGFFKNGELAAKMKIIPLEIFIQGQTFSMGGVASVATWPEHRRQGMIKQLLIHGLKVMRDSGQTVSLLHPFSFAYYRKYGWEHVFDEKKYTVPRDKLPKTDDMKGTIVRKRADDWPLLNRIYQVYAAKYNGPLIRNEEWWLHRSALKDKEATIAVYASEQNIPSGYIIYKVKRREMKVAELIHLDEEARHALWQFIANHDSMVDKVTLTVPADDALPFLLSEPSIKQEIVPYFMGRIVDVAAFIEQYPFRDNDHREHCTFHIEDRYAPWNDGTYTIQFDEEGTAHVTKIDQPTHASHPGSGATLGCDIQTLSAMLLGYQRPSFLHHSGRLQGTAEGIACLERRIPHRTPYFPDFF